MAVPYYGDFPTGHTGVIIPFNTFDSNDPSASVTITNLASTDVHIHKNGGTTQRTSAAGVTISIDFDTITGNHICKIDLSDDTDPSFYAAGSEISVRLEGTTIDAATVNAWIGAFSIERAGGTVALLKLIQAATITNAAGADIAADIIAIKAETAAIVNDTDVIDDGTSGLVKIASDVAAVLADTGTTIPGTITTLQTDVTAVRVDTSSTLNGIVTSIAGNTTAILADTNELQTDWTNAGRLDAILDTIAADTTTDIPATITTLQTDVTAIRVDTSSTLNGIVTSIAGNTTAILVDTGTTLQAELDGIQADTEDIQSRLPAALSSGNIKADVLAISTSTDAADKLEASAETIVIGAAAAGTLSTTQMTTDLTEATNDHYNGRVIIWTSGVLIQQATDITDYDGATKMLTFTAVTEAPTAADTFVIV